MHLSDPQFGPKHRFAGTAPESLFGRLRDDFEDMRARHGLVPDLILVTGDLVETGKPSEFKQFKAFAEATVEHFGLPRRRLVMIPGNHDINRAAADSYFKQCEADETTPRLPYWPKLRHYAAMFAEFYEREPDLTFTEAAPYTWYEFPDLGVVVAGLDSTIADSHRSEDHYGFLGEPQLRHFAGKLRVAADQGLLRVAAVHHHPIRPEGDPARQDLRDLKRYLGPYLNLVVHGHLHEDELDWLDSDVPVPVLGIGSAGVKAPQRPEEVPNQYQWIRVSADGFEYGSRAFIPDQKRWVGDVRPDRDGEQWWQRRKAAFHRVTALASAPTATTGASDALARAVHSHRAAMARQLRQRPLLIDLATFGEDSDLAQGIELLKLFIPQRATHEVPRSDRLERPVHAPRRPEVEFMTDPSTPTRTIDQLLVGAEHPWTFVLGTPGAGKTTLTMWLALKLCAEGEQLAGLPSDLVPVRVELRRFVERWAAAHRTARSYDFFDYLDDVHREMSSPLRADLLRELAAAGRLLWLFDGLDEVANADHRAEIAGMIVGLRAAHAGRGVVTGRIVGCRHLRARFHAASVHCFTLLDLSDPQISEFLDLWHRLAFPHAVDLGARRRERLRQALDDNPAVRDLCRNPLLLTLVALLNRGDELPRRRHKLLERATALMIEQWETNKHLPAVDAIQFDAADKGRYLAELAWHMLVDLPEGAGNIVEGEALERFTVAFCARRFTASPHSAAVNARALVQQLRERNYVLGLLGGTQFGFLHKAFFEFFAAEEVVHRFRGQRWKTADLGRIFAERWRADTWTEVLRLICGLLQEDRSEPVVAALQAVLATPKPTQHGVRIESITFVVKCLTEVRRLEAGPALALALALNRYLAPAIRLYYSTLPHRFILFGPTETDLLATAMRETDGHWPGTEQMLSELANGSAPGSWDLFHILLAALPGDVRVRWYVSLIETHVLPLAALPHAAGVRSIWRKEDTRLLRDVLHDRPQMSVEVTLAVVALMFEAGGFDESIWAELERGAAASLVPALLPLGARLRTAEPLDWHARAELRARFVEAVLPRVAEELRVELVRDWVHYPGVLRRFGYSPDALKRGAGPTLEDPDLARRFACEWHDEALLRRSLATGTSDPSTVLRELFDNLDDWTMGLEIFRAWLQEQPDQENARRLTAVTEVGVPPENADEDAVARALRGTRRADGTPDEAIFDLTASQLRRLEMDEVIRGIDAALEAYADSPYRLAVELRLLSWTQELDTNGEMWWDEAPLARFERALATAANEQPWLVLVHLGALPEARERATRLQLSAPEFVTRLRSSTPVLLNDAELRAASIQARKLPGAPWEVPLRHLLERDTTVQFRVDAALDLEDWAWLRRAADSTEGDLRTAAQAALDVASTLEDLLRVGRLRRAGIWRAGVRVGRLDELQGGATRFTYDPQYLKAPNPRPIAPNLPLQSEPFDAAGLHPVFEGLLPQGWMRDIDLDKYRLKPGDQFGLLLATGRHTIGALEILPEGDAL